MTTQVQTCLTADLFDQYAEELRSAFTIRLTEQKLLDLFAQGKLSGTIHTCIGQEFTGIAVARNLQPGDAIFSNHRCHGHYLARYDDVEGLIAEIMGRRSGVCRGRGGSQHLHCDGFFSNGIQGGFAPIAAGHALGQKWASQGHFGAKQDQNGYKAVQNDSFENSKNSISVLFIGDGTLGQGVLYETLNIASLWQAPVLIVLENNRYAQSTPQSQNLAGQIADRFAAFYITTAQSNTWDWQTLFLEASRAVEYVRTRQKPFFLQIDTYRLMSHSKGDDFRNPLEIKEFTNKDPLHNILKHHADDPPFIEFLDSIQSRIDRAAESAEQIEELAEDVLSPVKPVTIAPSSSSISWTNITFPEEKIVQDIRRAMEEALAENPHVVMLGEDIEDPYGGAFKVTAGLSTKYPGRVRNTPISEAALVGFANGLCLQGYIAVAEIMFGDFLTLAADQWINQAGKIASMYGDAVKVPLILRTPMGGGRGYGPTHSQSLEKYFVGVPGTQVLCLHGRYSPYLLYKHLFQTIDRPTLVIENKILYGQKARSVPPTGFSLMTNNQPFPAIRLKPHTTPDVTLLAIGGIGMEAEKAICILFDEYEIAADLFLPTRLYPMNTAILRDSIEQSRRLIVIEEGQGFAGLGSEVISQVAEQYPKFNLKCGRVFAKPCPIPAGRDLEHMCLPDAHAIVVSVLEIVR